MKRQKEYRWKNKENREGVEQVAEGKRFVEGRNMEYTTKGIEGESKIKTRERNNTGDETIKTIQRGRRNIRRNAERECESQDLCPANPYWGRWTSRDQVLIYSLGCFICFLFD